MSVTPTQSNVQTALRSFLVSILPPGVEVIEAQDNRVPEPASPDFVVMTILRDHRLETNVNTLKDAKFTGSISGTLLTITQVFFGSLSVGSTIFGVGILSGTVISSLGTGTGGLGTYNVSQSQTISSEVISAGTQSIMQPVQVTMQLDVHGPNSSENSRLISTLFRDDFSVQQFATSGFDVTPLYADDPKQVPFENAEQQYETRWVIEAHLQVNFIVIVPLQFADAITIGLKEVDATFHP